MFLDFALNLPSYASLLAPHSPRTARRTTTT